MYIGQRKKGVIEECHYTTNVRLNNPTVNYEMIRVAAEARPITKILVSKNLLYSSFVMFPDYRRTTHGELLACCVGLHEVFCSSGTSVSVSR